MMKQVMPFVWLLVVLVSLDATAAWMPSARRTGEHGYSQRVRHERLWRSAPDSAVQDELNGALSLSLVEPLTESVSTEQRNLRFAGVGRLYADESKATTHVEPHLQVIDRMTQATVIVVGLGGVGSWAAEALCRSGVGNLVLIDLDDICISNTNRQIHAMSSTVGQMKIDEMKRRLLDINPECNVTLIHDFVSQENVHEILESLLPNVTALLDGIDGAKAKSALLAACTDLRIPVVTSGGAAGRVDPTQIVCADITTVEDDRLLSTCRKEMRKRYGFGRGLSFQEKRSGKKKVKKWRIEAVYSLEEQKSLPAGDDSSSFRRCDGALGTSCFVTGAYGFAAASRIIAMIAQDKLKPPMRPRH